MRRRSTPAASSAGCHSLRRQLRATILSTGLFEHNLNVRVERRHAVGIFARVRRGDRMVTLSTSRFGLSAGHEHTTKATPTQVGGLAQIEALLADTTAWSLPTTAWADREVRAFVPSHYVYRFDRSAPDLTKLPSPLLPYKELFGHDCQIVTTGELRAILQAFLEAGITPVGNHALSSLSYSRAFADSPRAPTSALPCRRTPADPRSFCQLANRATGAAVDVFGQPAQRRR
jgi:hypothetical protein